jgi:hypothetical protein
VRQTSTVLANIQIASAADRERRMRTSILAFLLGAGALILGLAIGLIVSGIISGDISDIWTNWRALVH